MTTTYTVSGMTCAHCVRAVTEEVAKIEGVTDVGVDLASGRVTVESARAIDDARRRRGRRRSRVRGDIVNAGTKLGAFALVLVAVARRRRRHRHRRRADRRRQRRRPRRARSGAPDAHRASRRGSARLAGRLHPRARGPRSSMPASSPSRSPGRMAIRSPRSTRAPRPGAPPDHRLARSAAVHAPAPGARPGWSVDRRPARLSRRGLPRVRRLPAHRGRALHPRRRPRRPRPAVPGRRRCDPRSTDTVDGFEVSLARHTVRQPVRDDGHRAARRRRRHHGAVPRRRRPPRRPARRRPRLPPRPPARRRARRAGPVRRGGPLGRHLRPVLRLQGRRRGPHGPLRRRQRPTPTPTAARRTAPPASDTDGRHHLTRRTRPGRPGHRRDDLRLVRGPHREAPQQARRRHRHRQLRDRAGQGRRCPPA